MRLSERVRAGSEAAPWVVDEIKKLEEGLGFLREARLALEMWKDVAPAVSLCADIDKFFKEYPQ